MTATIANPADGNPEMWAPDPQLLGCNANDNAARRDAAAREESRGRARARTKPIEASVERGDVVPASHLLGLCAPRETDASGDEQSYQQPIRIASREAPKNCDSDSIEQEPADIRAGVGGHRDEEVVALAHGPGAESDVGSVHQLAPTRDRDHLDHNVNNRQQDGGQQRSCCDPAPPAEASKELCYSPCGSATRRTGSTRAHRPQFPCCRHPRPKAHSPARGRKRRGSLVRATARSSPLSSPATSRTLPRAMQPDEEWLLGDRNRAKSTASFGVVTTRSGAISASSTTNLGGPSDPAREMRKKRAESMATPAMKMSRRAVPHAFGPSMSAPEPRLCHWISFQTIQPGRKRTPSAERSRPRLPT